MTLLTNAAIAQRVAALRGSHYWMFIKDVQKALLSDTSLNRERRNYILQHVEYNFELDRQRIKAFATCKDAIPELKPEPAWLRLIRVHVPSDAGPAYRDKVCSAIECLRTAHQQMLERQAAEQQANIETEERRQQIVKHNSVAIRMGARFGFYPWVRVITTPLKSDAKPADRAQLQTAINQTDAVRAIVLDRRHIRARRALALAR